jgi:hypothetical protein
MRKTFIKQFCTIDMLITKGTGVEPLIKFLGLS